MNRRLLALNLILVLLLVWGGIQLRGRWQEARRHEAEVLAKAPAPLAVPPPAPLNPVTPAPATDYIDVAQHTLFSADRNPNVEIQVEAPKPPPPEPPVPPMPVYYGQMAITKPVILFGSSDVPQKAYSVGDEVGGFKIIAFDRDNVTLGWNGKELRRELKTLAAQTPPPAARNPTSVNAAPANARPANGAQAARNAAVPSAAPAKSISKAKSGPALGPPIGENRRGCVGTDDSPAGTVFEGYKKVISVSLMGQGCYWESNK